MTDVLKHLREKSVFAITILVAPAALVAPRGLAIILPALFLILLWRSWRSIDISGLSRFVGVPEILLLICFAGLSLLWVAEPGAAAGKLFSLSILALVGLGLLYVCWQTERDDLRRALIGFAIGAFATLLYFAIEVLSGGAIIRNIRGFPWDYEKYVMTFRDNGVFPLNRGVTMISLLVWPAVGYFALTGRRTISVVALGLTVVLIYFATPQAPLLGMLLGIATFVVVFLRARIAVLALAAIFALGILSAPLLQKALPDPEIVASDYRFIPSSGVLRLAIWEETVELVSDRPWIGWGFLGSRMFYDEDDARSTVLVNRGNTNAYNAPSEPIPLHPHNAVLQWWLELGFVGAALFALFVFRALRALARHSETLPRVVSASVSACFVSAAASLSLSYGAWQTWWVSGLLLTATMSLCLVVYAKDSDARGGTDAVL